jgi:hypothetical protein
MGGQIRFGSVASPRRCLAISRSGVGKQLARFGKAAISAMARGT